MPENRHVFLILAKENNEVLREMRSRLEDSNMDFLVHVMDDPADNYLDSVYQLIQAAVEQGSYSYYHILPGNCLPLKTPEQIRFFFESREGEEFITITGSAPLSELQPPLKNLLHMKKKTSYRIKTGSPWASVTDSFARYLLLVHEYADYLFAQAPDAEHMFLPTMAANSDYKDRISDENIFLKIWPEELSRAPGYPEALQQKMQDSLALFAGPLREENL